MSSKLQLDVSYLKLKVAPSGERLRKKGRHRVFAGKTRIHAWALSDIHSI